MRVSVLGAGPGGYVAALTSARSGAQVTVIQDEEVGGTCLNRGCIPTKTFVASAELLARTRKLGAFGLELNGTIVPNLSKIVDRKNTVIKTQAKGIRGLLKSWGVTLKTGRGVLVSPREIEVTAPDGSRETIESDNIIIATGSKPAEIPALPFDGKHIISSTEALDLREIPGRLLIVGAGVIGCEFAFIYRELGSEVTIVEMLPRAVPHEDHEISEILERELKKKKIKLLTNAGVSKAVPHDGGIRVFLSDGRELSADKLLVAVGRSFNSDNIGLESIGVTKGSRGEIVVNSRMQTSVPGVYAVGDVTGGILLAHVASAEGVVAAKNITGITSEMNYLAVPSAIFTSPEIGSVGMREQEARDKGITYRVGRFPFRSLGKAHAMDEISGVVKIISDKSSGRVLGAHIIGPHASDLIHEAAVAIQAGLTVNDIAGTIHAHPTLAEGIKEAAEDVFGEAVHVGKKTDE